MLWKKICQKLNYLFLLSLTEAVRLIVRFFLKDAEIFLQRYPILTAELDPQIAWQYLNKDISEIVVVRFFLKDVEIFLQRYPLLTAEVEPQIAWHYLKLNISEIIAYSIAKSPQFIPIVVKLAIAFSLLISAGLISLGGLIGFKQAQTLENQATHFSMVLATQAAYALRTPVLLNDAAEEKAIINKLMQEKTIVNVTLYASDHSVINSYGSLPKNALFSKEEIKYTADTHFLTAISNNILGKVKTAVSFTVPIKQDDLLIGYLALSLDHSALEQIRVETLQTTISITLGTLLVGIIAAFYMSKLITKPLNDLMNASAAISRGNFDYKFQLDKRKDELGVLMQAMNEMNKGLLQKDKVEAVFSRYVSAQVARQVLSDLDNESVKLGGEHVMASVFFADIVGFTSLSETLSPQEISEILNVYFSKITQVVSFCGGHVDKFIGDCAMVVFGVPLKTPQHAFDCIACAWMILQLVAALNDEREARGEVTAEFRIGANSGMMLAGNMGSSERMEYTVVGDSVNLASRLSGTGEPGQLIITEDVFIEQGLEGAILTEVKDLIKLRGKKLPVKILNVKDILTPFKEQMLNEIPLIIAADKKN
jgi:adenylate cyclase